MTKSPFTPNPNLKVQILELPYCNDIFLMAAKSGKLDKHAALHSFLYLVE